VEVDPRYFRPTEVEILVGDATKAREKPHLHFVANEQAKARLAQLGEQDASTHVIGSPDIDVMNSDALPSINEVRRHYDFAFQHYAVLAFHPVTSELDDLQRQVRVLVD
jgi:UDP-N-acetylglucosamine 2-epimerase (hydrolysing)